MMWALMSLFFISVSTVIWRKILLTLCGLQRAQDSVEQSQAHLVLRCSCNINMKCLREEMLMFLSGE